RRFRRAPASPALARRRFRRAAVSPAFARRWFRQAALSAASAAFSPLSIQPAALSPASAKVVSVLVFVVCSVSTAFLDRAPCPPAAGRTPNPLSIRAVRRRLAAPAG